MPDNFMQVAFEEAQKSYNQGGIPIGSVLVYQDRIIGKGHNKRVQNSSVILHGEMDALENAGRLPAKVYAECTLYTTLSPCPMCSGTILLYKIPKVVIAENKTFLGAEDYLISNGVIVEHQYHDDCYQLIQKFIEENPELWNEDIGE